MKKPYELGDLPEGETISYEHFIYYLEQGREIEFTLKNQLYFIDKAQKGRALWSGLTQLSGYSTVDNQAFLAAVKIDEASLAELLKSKEIKITTIF